MTLFEKLKEIINDGFAISMAKDLNQVVIRVYYAVDNPGKLETHQKQSVLPLFDHFYESKIVDCIDYMVKEIKSEPLINKQ